MDVASVKNLSQKINLARLKQLVPVSYSLVLIVDPLKRFHVVILKTPMVDILCSLGLGVFHQNEGDKAYFVRKIAQLPSHSETITHSPSQICHLE